MKGSRVLVVDDDAHIVEVMEMRLAAMGLEVTATGNPQEALRALDEQSFDAALFDLRMEPMNGLLLMEAAHGKQPRLPVIIMTAHGTIDNAVQAVQRGAFDYITKPFVAEELRGKLGRALSERRWARDRHLLRAVGDILGSSGTTDRILEAVAQATVEATEAQRAVVFLLEDGRLAALANAGSAATPVEALRSAAEAAVDKRAPTTLFGDDGRVTLAAPLLVEGGAAGALVVEGPARVTPTEDDLELLSLFSSQAAVALRSAHELARLRSGALAALGRMAAEVAHELRNPLGGLKLYARHLEERLTRAEDAQGAEIAQKISRAIDHLAELVTDITAFGRPPQLARESTPLNGLLEDCLALVEDRVNERQVHVVRELDRTLPAMALDPRQLRKVFLNLIVNGLDALEAGGTLAVRSRRVEPGVVEVAVEDTGCGMSEETRARIFDLFFTTKADGTGLGMGIARSVVELHDGTLEVESQPGCGTRVLVRLAIAEPS